MRPFATFALWFAGAVLATCIAWSAVGVYALDGYERGWGAGGTFQVLTWISLAVSVVALFSSGVGARFGGMTRRAPIWLPVTLGILFVLLNFLLGKVMEASGFPPNRAVVILWVVLVPAAIGLLVAPHFRDGRL